MTGSTLSNDFAQTPIVFIGRVVKKIPSRSSFGNVEYTMKVEEAFKGTTVGKRVKVHARESGPSCGIGIIAVGDRRQIWLSASGTTGSCTRTTSDVNKNRVELQQLAHNSSSSLDVSNLVSLT